MSNILQKLQISLSSAALFTFMNMSSTYKLTDSLLDNKLLDSVTKCPNFAGIIIHTIVFFVLTFFSMQGSEVNIFTKLKHTIYGTLIYFFVSNPVTYKLVASLFGNWVADSNGCPTDIGVFLHTIVYLMVLFGVMFLPGSKA
jgi:uncharacterized membrane protein YwzB